MRCTAKTKKNIREIMEGSQKHKHKVLMFVIFGTGGILASYYHIFAAEDQRTNAKLFVFFMCRVLVVH